jgi:hypothetical protein
MSSRRTSLCVCVAGALLLAAMRAAAQGAGVPRLDRITASVPAAFRTTVTGAAGAVPASAWVMVIHLDTGHYEIVQAGGDGSFSTTLFAAPGGTLEIKTDPAGAILKPVHEGPPYLTHHVGGEPAMWGTMLQLPGPTGGAGLRFGISGPTAPLPVWYAEGSVDPAASPGGTLRIEGTYTLFGSAAAGQQPSVDVQAGLIAVTRADGKGVVDQAVFASSVMTPTGLPIERHGWLWNAGRVAASAALQPSEGGLSATFAITMPVPNNLPPGHYRPLLSFRPRGTAEMSAETTKITRQITMKRAWQDQLIGLLPVVRIGEPAAPWFDATLLVNEFHAGARGVDAAEARGRFSLAPRIAMPSERLIVPRGTRNIEPFIPSLIVSDRSEPLTPARILFRFPSGSLTATVRRPDGSTRTIGPKPFVQPVIEPLARLNSPLENGPSLSTTVRLSTLDPAFDVPFDRDGPHTITIDAALEDVWGNLWRCGGTYEIDVAEPLVLEPGFMPGTPFEAGDRIPLHLRVSPPIAADVDVRYRFASASGAVREEIHRLRTNRFGHAAGPAIAAGEPGEYRIDLFAAGSDAGGVRRAGSMTWGNVIAPRESALVAHGKRGIDDMPDPRPQWFSRKQLNRPINAAHTFFPFHSGDVQWMTDETQEAGITAVSFHDPLEVVAPALRTAYAARPYGSPGFIETALADGEAPLLSLSSTGIDAHIAPELVDYWSYGYRFVERPALRVRETVAEEPGPFTYWRFQDRYGLQPGNGANGDLPNDFKFQFGGVVVRGSSVARPQYALYGSLMVIVPPDDALGTRVTPPFQGNGGGPNGGPLFLLKGREIDLFFHPTGLRPGTILQVGERIAFTGHSAPPLPSKVAITVISPSGRVRTISGQANAVGFFADPSRDFTADEPGVWTARIGILFDGRTSGGPVAEPYPAGDVLGSREGEFHFYVVPSAAAPLAVNGPGTRLVRPSDGPITFTAAVPPGLRNVEMATTTTMPGFILEETRGTSLTYAYDAQKLAKDFPNIDLRDHDGAAGVDTITISFFVSGTDESGRRQYLARQIVIQGEELQMTDQLPRPKRRAR